MGGLQDEKLLEDNAFKGGDLIDECIEDDGDWESFKLENESLESDGLEDGDCLDKGVKEEGISDEKLEYDVVEDNNLMDHGLEDDGKGTYLENEGHESRSTDLDIDGAGCEDEGSMDEKFEHEDDENFDSLENEGEDEGFGDEDEQDDELEDYEEDSGGEMDNSEGGSNDEGEWQSDEELASEELEDEFDSEDGQLGDEELEDGELENDGHNNEESEFEGLQHRTCWEEGLQEESLKELRNETEQENCDKGMPPCTKFDVWNPKEAYDSFEHDIYTEGGSEDVATDVPTLPSSPLLEDESCSQVTRFVSATRNRNSRGKLVPIVAGAPESTGVFGITNVRRVQSAASTLRPSTAPRLDPSIAAPCRYFCLPLTRSTAPASQCESGLFSQGSLTAAQPDHNEGTKICGSAVLGLQRFSSSLPSKAFGDHNGQKPSVASVGQVDLFKPPKLSPPPAQTATAHPVVTSPNEPPVALQVALDGQLRPSISRSGTPTMPSHFARRASYCTVSSAPALAWQRL